MRRQKISKERNTPARTNHANRKAAASHDSPLLGLQHSIGNHAVQRLIHSPYIQAKLQVSEPGDEHEQEADRVADTVMRMPVPESSKPPIVSAVTQPDEEEDKVIATKSKPRVPLAVREDDDEERVHLKADGAATNIPGSTANHIASMNGRGSPLPDSTRAFFEPRFGADFSNVRVHTDSQAAESAGAINSRAFTVGPNIAFGPGQYAPESEQGRQLLAHELTHVLQQSHKVSPMIQRDGPSESAISPLWDKVNAGYTSLMGNLARVNQKAPTVARARLNDELFAYASQVGGPGEKSDAELKSLQNTLDQFENRVQTLNDDAQKQWGVLIGRYQDEERRLAKLIDEPASVKALEILDKEYYATMRRVDAVETFLVDEDLLQFQHMLDTAKHVQLGELYESRNQLGPREVSASDTGEGIRATGDVSVAVGSTMTSEAGLREVYQKGARQITETALRDVAKGVPVERAARWAHQARNDLKVLIRSRGSSIVRGFAEARNINKYGNEVGPTYEELIRKGKTPTDIIGSAGKANVKTNRFASRLKVGGRLLLAVDIAIVTWEVFTAPEGERLRTAVSGVAGLGGAAAGGWAGAKVGGTIGSAFGPVGTVIGGIIGAIGGALFGGWAGRKAGAAIYDFFDELINPGSEWDDFSSGIDDAEDEYFEANAGGQK